MKKIIIPTDFSDNAKKAADIGAKLAERSNAEIVLFHAYHVPGTGRPIMIDLSDLLKKESKEKLQEEKKRILEKHKLEIECVAEYGPAVPLVADLAKKIHADLIVMGTTGASGVKEYFFGSNTSGLINETDVPILAIPYEGDYSDPEKIVFAWDLKNVKDKEINTIKEIAGLFNAKINVLHVNDEGDNPDVENILLKDLALSLDNADFQSITSDDVEEAIIHAVNGTNAIFSVVARKHGFLERLFHKSISKTITNHAKHPILIMKES